MLRMFTLWLMALILLPQASLAEEGPSRVVEEGYHSLQEHIKSGTLSADQSTEALYNLLEQELTPSIDFPRIARKVMGKYARLANDQQLQAFTEVFKRTLITTYSKGLENLHLLDRVDIEPGRVDREGERATVRTLVVLTTGEQYKVDYSLYMNGAKQWMVENIIVEGLNIGLTFRNQFAHLMETHGSIDAAIANWSDDSEPSSGSGDNKAA